MKDRSVAHKTGTLVDYACEVSNVGLPHKLGNITVFFYIQDSPQDRKLNEHILAEIEKILYDYL